MIVLLGPLPSFLFLPSDAQFLACLGGAQLFPIKWDYGMEYPQQWQMEEEARKGQQPTTNSPSRIINNWTAPRKMERKIERKSRRRKWPFLLEET
jgi:hypothetical protein